ncbi:MAG TPA: hypothetical protein VL688_05935 [Verrucomicrobiae bacterium]|nr:hypothetical protein [Verrucomicrobiae bacterium]
MSKKVDFFRRLRMISFDNQRQFGKTPKEIPQKKREKEGALSYPNFPQGNDASRRSDETCDMRVSQKYWDNLWKEERVCVNPGKKQKRNKIIPDHWKAGIELMEWA